VFGIRLPSHFFHTYLLQSHSFILWLGLKGNFYWRLELHTFENIEITQVCVISQIWLLISKVSIFNASNILNLLFLFVAILGLFFVNILIVFFSFEFIGKAIVIMGVSGAGKS
jgi:hypothetical protein